MWDPGVPGAGPKCFLASLSLGPLRSKVLVPIFNIQLDWKRKRTCRGEESQLIKSKAFTSSLNDSSSSGFSESKSSNGDLGDL